MPSSCTTEREGLRGNSGEIAGGEKAEWGGGGRKRKKGGLREAKNYAEGIQPRKKSYNWKRSTGVEKEYS